MKLTAGKLPVLRKSPITGRDRAVHGSARIAQKALAKEKGGEVGDAMMKNSNRWSQKFSRARQRHPAGSGMGIACLETTSKECRAAAGV